MRRIHPNLAGAVFILVYYSIGLLISLLIKVKLYESKIFIGIGFIGIFIINRLFINRYYDAIADEKREEKEFFKKAIENRKKMENKE